MPGPRPIPPSRLYRRRPWTEAPLVALDFEATGLDLSRDTIVSFGTLPVQGGQVLLAGATYVEVSPDVTPSHESIAVHHLRPQELASAASLDEAKEALRSALERRYLLTWVAEVETSFLAKLFGGTRWSWARRTIDVFRLVATLDRREGRRVPTGERNLSATAARFGVPVEESHHALDDALMTAELFLVMAAKLAPHGITELSRFLGQTGSRPAWYR